MDFKDEQEKEINDLKENLNALAKGVKTLADGVTTLLKRIDVLETIIIKQSREWV